jgi:hypothetical protein
VCVAQGACRSAPRRAAAQMVLAALQVRHPTRLVHPIAKDTDARLGPPASDASVDPDAVRPAADCLVLCPEVVRDSRLWALADAPVPKAV